MLGAGVCQSGGFCDPGGGRYAALFNGPLPAVGSDGREALYHLVMGLPPHDLPGMPTVAAWRDEAAQTFPDLASSKSAYGSLFPLFRACLSFARDAVREVRAAFPEDQSWPLRT